MNSTASRIPTAASVLPSQQVPINHRNLIKQTEERQQRQENTNAKTLTLTLKMAFTIDHRNHSMTVTVSDGATGELVRKLIYDHGSGAPMLSKSMGQMLDVRT
jgi:uncharacterized FlaG/YvyC family protein